MKAFYNSTVGKKAIMAVSGLIGVGFVIGHAAGNMLAFVGREKINAYSAALHGPLGELLWVARAVLLVAVVLHVVMAWQLTRRAHAARRTEYEKKEAEAASFASTTMRWGGVYLLVFIVFHLLHLTLRRIDPGFWATRMDAAGRVDVYGNLVASFRVPWVSAVYLTAMIFLGLHLWHGVWSFGRSLGVAPASAKPQRRPVAIALAVLLWLAFSSVPIAVMAGVIR